jgi:hypothetical protein
MPKYISILVLLCSCVSGSNSISTPEQSTPPSSIEITTSTNSFLNENINEYPVSKDVKCTSFVSKDDLNNWWNKYYPIYGDIAELDLDNDGIPCNGNTNTNLYSSKRELNNKVNQLVSQDGYLQEALDWCSSDPFLDKVNIPDLGTPESDIWIDAKITRQVGEKAFSLVGDRWPEYLYKVLTSNREAFSSREFGSQLYRYYIFGGDEESYNNLVPTIWTVQEAEYYGVTLYAEACLLAYDDKDRWFDRHENWAIWKQP